MTHQPPRHQVPPNTQRQINDDAAAILSDLYALIHLILNTTLQGKYYYYFIFYFADEESEAQTN